MTARPIPAVSVISGGTALNSILRVFDNYRTSYILSVSDNGGSSSEILRVLGGPSIGDIRSRLVRVVPTLKSGPSGIWTEDDGAVATQRLLAYRLGYDEDIVQVKEEYHEILEGIHWLWKDIPQDKKECIRSFLVHFNSQILHRAHKRFDFRNASIGNMFLSGSQMFFRNLESAIFLFGAITGIPPTIKVIPAIHTNHRTTIAAILRDKTIHTGQCAISHPAAHDKAPSSLQHDRADSWSASSNVKYDKRGSAKDKLSSPIEHLYYINEYGQEIYPIPNAQYLEALSTSDVLVYGIGSLYTSIMPCLTLRSIGRRIASSKTLKRKILLLNAYNDRETPDYSASDFILAIIKSLQKYSFSRLSHLQAPGTSPGIDTLTEMQSQYFDHRRSQSSQTTSTPSTPVNGQGRPETEIQMKDLITDLVYLPDGGIKVNVAEIENWGIRCTSTSSTMQDNTLVYDESKLATTLEGMIDSCLR